MAKYQKSLLSLIFVGGFAVLRLKIRLATEKILTYLHKTHSKIGCIAKKYYFCIGGVILSISKI